MIVLMAMLYLSVLFFMGSLVEEDQKRGTRLFFAIALFLIGGIWMAPAFEERQVLYVSLMNQLSCLAFIGGEEWSRTADVSDSPTKEKGLAMALFIGVFSMLISTMWVYLLEYLKIDHQEQEMVELFLSGESSIQVLTFVFVVFVAPLSEELLFRQLLLPFLARSIGFDSAILASGIVFGLIHFESATSVLPLMVFGVLLGWLRWKYDSIYPSILSHMTNNLLAMILLWNGCA